MIALLLAAFLADGSGYRAGVAVRSLAPPGPMWLAGYAARTRPFVGQRHDIFAKALVLEDANRQRLALVTTDLLGLSAELADGIAADVEKAVGIPRARLMLTSSHTHSAPVLPATLADMYPLSPAELAKVQAYGLQVRAAVVGAVAAACGRMQDVVLSHGEGRATFAMNRRAPGAGGVALAANPPGPVDWSVPVLKVATPAGKLVATAFGYACHNTTLDDDQMNGDYAGYAMLELERRHPGAAAMFWSGCGGDANPEPRGRPAHAETHGAALANAVDRVLGGQPQPLHGEFRAEFLHVSLAFGPLPTRERWQADLKSPNFSARQRATRHLALLDAGKTIPAAYERYPVQAWRLGDGPTWLALGGEVLVGYAQRLKAELPGAVWVTAYANDVMGYIPTKKALAEGGYEADSSMVYYGLPTRWAPELEERIIAAAKRLAAKVSAP